MAYNTDPNVQTLAKSVTQAGADIKAQIWVRSLQLGAQQNDDFSIFEGPDEGEKPVYVRQDLTKDGGDKMTFTVMGGLAGNGVRGENELTGNTSRANFKTFDVIVDFWRDGFELSKKQRKFMAAGGDLPAKASMLLRNKLGLKKQRDAMISLRQQASGNTIRPNGRLTRDTITKDDKLTPDYVVWAKAQAARIGARPINVSKDRNRSPVQRYLCFATESAMLGIRTDNDYVAACTNAANRGDENPLFSGRLVDWNNIAFFEHYVVDPPVRDVIGSPLSPRIIHKGDAAISPANTTCVITGYSAAELTDDSTINVRLFAQDMPGYRYEFTQDVKLDADSTTYYAWGITPTGRVGFVSYVGSTGNNGKTITLNGILSPATGGTDNKANVAGKTLGNLNIGNEASATDHVITLGTTGDNLPTTFTYVDEFPTGTVFLPANANGVLIGHSFLFGRGALCRAYGSIRELPTEEIRDFGFINGWGYESIFGQAPYQDADGRTSNYVLLEHAIDIPGYDVPEMVTA